MGVFSRLSDIINSNINSMLDKAEDPEKIARLIIQEMEDCLVEVRSAAARSMADKKEYERDIKTLEQTRLDWSSKAELAVEKGREDLARGALSAKQRAEREIDGRRQAIARNPAGRFQLFRIGDAVASRNIHAAIYEALRLAKNV